MTTLLVYPGAGSDSNQPSLVAIERAVAPAAAPVACRSQATATFRQPLERADPWHACARAPGSQSREETHS